MGARRRWMGARTVLIRTAPYRPGQGAQGQTPGWVSELLRAVTRGYQRRWLSSTASFRALLGGRQLGKDRAAGIEVGFDLAWGKGRVWHLLSATQRHSHDLLREVRRFVELALRVSQSQGYGARRLTEDNKSALEIDGDCRVVSHPATPKTAQGSRGAGGVVLNEFGIMPRAREIYETVYAIITGQHDQGRASTLLVMGNASWRGSDWHGLWQRACEPDSGWWAHKATWERCQRDWRRELGWDAAQIDAWVAQRKAQIIADIGAAAYAQWYDCVWRAAEDSFFGPDLLERRSYDPLDPPEGFPSLSDHRVLQTIGWDPARKSHPSGLCQVLLGQGHHWAHEPRRMRGGKYSTWEGQVDEVERVSQQRQTLAVVGDETGPGDAPMELLEGRLGRKVQRYAFSQPSRLALARNALDALERGIARVPRDTDFLMELTAIHSEYGASGERLVIPVDGDTHADMAVAWMLAQWGASHGPAPRPTTGQVVKTLGRLRRR
jgi:hypothetical protein